MEWNLKSMKYFCYSLSALSLCSACYLCALLSSGALYQSSTNCIQLEQEIEKEKPIKPPYAKYIITSVEEVICE